MTAFRERSLEYQGALADGNGRTSTGVVGQEKKRWMGWRKEGGDI